MEFETWNTLAAALQRHSAEVVREGEAMLRFQRQQVEIMCAHPQWRVLGGHRVPVVNASAFFPEVGERLLQQYAWIPFSAYYMDRGDGKRQWGLRSRESFDVSQIAKAYGGGGHRTAAGFVEDAPAYADL
jgi:uncharacterized protein